MIREIFLCGCNYLLWSLPLFCILIILYRVKRPQKFLFRKLLHMTAFSGVVFMNERAESPIYVVSCLFIGAVATYGILTVMESFSFYKDFFSEKSPHEVKRNLSGFFLTAAVLEVIFTMLGKYDYFNAVILMWGFGDAFAALVGIPFGRHKLPVGDKKKSLEGSMAFIVAGVLCSGLYLFLKVPGFFMGWKSIVALVLVAILSSIAEIFSKEKWDNIIVPVVCAAGFLLF